MPDAYQIKSCDEEPGYRYRLDIRTDVPSAQRLVVIQLNPSTANNTKSDPTIGKVAYWAREHQFGAVTFLNLFARRTTYPIELIGVAYDDLVGTRNDTVTIGALDDAATVVLGWGRISRAIHHSYEQRLAALQALLGLREVHSVGACVGGVYPRHGRMWNGKNRDIRRYDWINRNG